MMAERSVRAADVRRQFIDFFRDRCGHELVASSPVVPHDDPTLLFANAGMNQFKPVFLGQVEPGSPFAGLRRAVNSQKCIRAGGKHNDLDDVGKDTYHHTFFEMLGNWSFGDYFKAEAVDWAWRLLTEVWGLDPERLYATYFGGSKELGLDADREAYELWTEHLPPQRVLPGNMKDNFWEMGDVGPCGPCSELHYDNRTDAQRAETPGYELVNKDHEQVIEIWNLVFIQFNRTAPTTLAPLPAKHVDTGMGFERIVRFLQGKSSNYDTDVFAPIFEAIKAATGAKPYGGSMDDPADTAYRVIADHVRTLTVAIADGAEPSNEGRGYVLRRVLRRAVRFGRQVLGVERPFLAEVVPAVAETLGEAFPNVRDGADRAAAIITDEEEAFRRTLDHGIKLFDRAASDAEAAGERSIDATHAFMLHDTYGFPIDLTQLMAEERGLTVDIDGFHRLMDEAKERSRAGAGGAAADGIALGAEEVAKLKHLRVDPTDDSFKHDRLRLGARVEAVYDGETFEEALRVTGVKPDQRIAVVLDKTPFYAEAGGQVGDRGRLRVTSEARTSATDPLDGGEFVVEDVRAFGGYVAHIGRVTKGEVRAGDRVEASVDKRRRSAAAANHTATHLLNLALREVFGRSVDQRGSLVAPERLRFDFSLGQPVDAERAAEVSRRVRDRVERDLPVHAETTPLELAQGIGTVRAVFGETYPDPVRVVSVGVPVADLLEAPDSGEWDAYSVEFCGGTHVATTGEIGAFAIVAEESVSKGVRRVTALTGEPAERAIAAARSLRSRVEGAATLSPAHLAGEVSALTSEIDAAEIPIEDKAALRAALAELQDKAKRAQKERAKAGAAAAADAARTLAAEATGDVVVGEIPGAADRSALLAAMDTVRGNRPDAAVLLLAADHDAGKVAMAAAVPKQLIARGLKAGDWVRRTAAVVGGKGGGKPDAAQGGGTEPGKLPDALDAARAFANGALSG